MAQTFGDTIIKVNEVAELTTGAGVKVGPKIGVNVSTPTYNVSLSGQADQTIQLERTTGGGAGAALTVAAAGATSAGTNLAGGTLNLTAGTATGSGVSLINLSAAGGGGSGSGDSAPAVIITAAGTYVNINKTTSFYSTAYHKETGAATVGTKTKNSLTTNLVTSYWTGSAAGYKNVTIQGTMISETGPIYALDIIDNASATMLRIIDNKNLLVGTTTDGMTTGGSLAVAQDLAHRGTKAGFFNTAPAAKPTVNGSKGANAALTSLMTALAGLGLVTDSTT